MDAVPPCWSGRRQGVDALRWPTEGRRGEIDDGRTGRRTPVTVAALRLLGVTVPGELATVPVIGGYGDEAQVGVIRAVSF